MKYKYKIVVDSAANLKDDYIKDENIGFSVVPLTVNIGEHEYQDTDNTSVEEMLKDLSSYKGKCSTSCPSPAYFEEAYKDAEEIICITISSKMSGCFNAAYLASTGVENAKIHVVDSLSVCGGEVVLVDKCLEFMRQGMPFEQIEEKIEQFKMHVNLLFVLNDFGNLVRAGRMNKIVAFVAMSLSIKPLCLAKDGEIKIYKKERTMKKALLTIVSDIKDFVTDEENRDCVITYVDNVEIANHLADLIKQAYKFRSVRVMQTRILCSYYTLPGGIHVVF